MERNVINLKVLLDEVVLFAIPLINNYPSKVIYHDIKFVHRLTDLVDQLAPKCNLSQDEILLSKIILWFYSCGFNKLKVTVLKHAFTSNNIENSIQSAGIFFENQNYPDDFEEKIKNSISRLRFGSTPIEAYEKFAADINYKELMSGKNGKHLKKYYEEWLLHGVPLGKKGWFDLALTLVPRFNFHHVALMRKLEDQKANMIKAIKKDKKDLEGRSELALKKELDISDDELKKLKKAMKKMSDKDDRGLQTIFRTTSRNHYTLNQMVDTKASIMISLNAIILSLIIGANMDFVEQSLIHSIPSLCLIITSALSISFAIISIRPNLTQGEFTIDEIRNKKGNLLYFGNFHNMHLRDYEWGMMQMFNDSDYLYGSMIRDIYFLGVALNKKFQTFRKSLNVFLIGLLITIFFFVVLKFYS